MIQFIKSLPFHFKSAFKNVFRHFPMSFSAISAVTVTLTLLSAFLLIAGNIAAFTQNVEAEIRIHVVCDETIENYTQIEEVKSKLEALPYVKRVEISSKENELEMMIKEKGEEFAMFRGQKNPLHNGYFVYLNDANQIDAVTDSIYQIEGIENAVYGGESVVNMVEFFKTIRGMEVIIVIILTALTAFLISSSIKMTIYARTTEIGIMRNVGATNWFIKTPFVIEGMIIGIAGAIVPALLTVYGYSYFYHNVGGKIITDLFKLLPLYPFTRYICFVLFGAGILVGVLGSFISTTKYLRWKR